MGRNETTMSMEKAIDIMAGHLAKKAAKAKGTESERYMEGYKDAVIWCAKHPLPADADLIAALDEQLAKLQSSEQAQEPSPIE